MLPAQRSWREIVWLLDVMWPRSNQWARALLGKDFQLYNNSRCWEFLQTPVKGCGSSLRALLFLLSVAGDVSFISFTGVAWDGKWEWWPCHMPENQRVLPSWSSWESICYVGIKISKLCELRNVMLLEWLALDLCSHSTYGFFATDITVSLYLRS